MFRCVLVGMLSFLSLCVLAVRVTVFVQMRSLLHLTDLLKCVHTIMLLSLLKCVLAVMRVSLFKCVLAGM